MTDREEFEKSDLGKTLPLKKDWYGSYISPATAGAWVGWQTCAAIKQKEIDELEARIKASQEQQPIAWKHGEYLYLNPCHDMTFTTKEARPLYAAPGIQEEKKNES